MLTWMYNNVWLCIIIAIILILLYGFIRSGEPAYASKGRGWSSPTGGWIWGIGSAMLITAGLVWLLT